MYERIRALREDRDLSQKQLSQALHCSQQVYSNYELGQREFCNNFINYYFGE